MISNKRYVHFEFPWWWIRNKQIIHRGNSLGGILIIADGQDNVIKMYGYERLDNEE